MPIELQCRQCQAYYVPSKTDILSEPVAAKV